MSQSFRLSVSNIIALGVIVLTGIAIFSVYSDNKTANDYAYLAGLLFSFLLLPVLIAWPVWRMSGHSKSAASLTFNIVLAMMVLGQVNHLKDELRRRNSVRDLAQQRENFKGTTAAIENPDDLETVAAAYTDSVQAEFTRMAESSTGDEQLFYQVMSDFVRETEIASQKWTDSYHAVLDSRILDASRLTSDEEFAYQLGILHNYVEHTQAHVAYVAETIPRLRNHLSVLGEGSEIARGALIGAKQKHFAQKPILDPFMQAHINYGNNMIFLLELLRKNRDWWEYTGEELSFLDEELLYHYNATLERIIQNEAEINTLGEKLVQSM